MQARTGRVEPATRRVAVDPGVELTVRVTAGDGVPFLLVHGLASNARMWDGVAARLAELGHPSAAVDQRGHGRSDKPPEGYDFATVTDDLVGVIAALGWDRPVVAGQSWGANVAVELAWRFPELVRGIACIDGGFIELAGRFSTWEACSAAMTPPPLAGMPAETFEARTRAAHPDWPESGIEGALACVERRADGTIAPWLSLDRHLLILRALWQHRPSTRFAELGVPVLLVPARKGAERPEVIETAAASLRCGRLVWMDGDHDLHAQHPIAVAELLAAHVADGFFS